MIVNGELTTGLGGGVCQVSTTVFNAAFEAGLKITERTNHALYISHYPQGRDATVDYPGVDLKFVNDTGNWLLLRTFVSSSSLTVSLYGTPVHRKVDEHDEPARRARQAAGEEDGRSDAASRARRSSTTPGVPAMSTSVTRDVYADGRQAALPRHVVLVVPRRAEARAPRAGEEEAEEEARDDDDDDDDDDETTTTQPTQ